MRRASHKGQALAEFALVIPILFLLVIAIGDFGRLFTAAIGVESAAREAADYGAFLGSDRWASVDAPWTTNGDEIIRRACQAASELPGFSDPDGTCTTNPVVTWELLTWNMAADNYDVVDPLADECAGRLGLVVPCVVHVTVTFAWRPTLSILPIPGTITLTRDAWFAISDLTGI